MGYLQKKKTKQIRCHESSSINLIQCEFGADTLMEEMDMIACFKLNGNNKSLYFIRSWFDLSN